ncbi:MAG TPA: hypothetical protein VEP50_17855 [bacterium]|nr:hypothetical protein [bacterium]
MPDRIQPQRNRYAEVLQTSQDPFRARNLVHLAVHILVPKQGFERSECTLGDPGDVGLGVSAADRLADDHLFARAATS